MKRLISGVLLTVAVAASVPLPVLWFTQASAQDQPGPKPQQAEAQKNFTRKSDFRNRDQEDRTRKLLSDYSRTDDEKERARVLSELTDIVSDQFDLRQENRERELKELEEHVRKLRELHQRRAKEKDQIVRDRVRQLLRDVDGLGWGDDGQLRPSSPAREGAVREK